MSSRFAIPNNPAKLGSNRLAPGMSNGERAGKECGPIMVHPNNPVNKKKEVAEKNPAKRESVPNNPPVEFCNHNGQSRRVVSVANKSNEIVSKMNGSIVRKSSYHPTSGPKAIRATTIRGRERNKPS